MIKIRNILYASLMVTSILISCATDPVAHDLVAYVNQGILGITPLEIQAIDRYQGVTGENFTSMEALRLALADEIIPTYEKFLLLLKKIRTGPEAVKQLHRLYVNGAEMILEGFVGKRVALEKGDNPGILAANQKIEQGSELTQRWREELFKLYQQYHVAQEQK